MILYHQSVTQIHHHRIQTATQMRMRVFEKRMIPYGNSSGFASHGDHSWYTNLQHPTIITIILKFKKIKLRWCKQPCQNWEKNFFSFFTILFECENHISNFINVLPVIWVSCCYQWYHRSEIIMNFYRQLIIALFE